ncbi:MAG TPA: DUF3592 domain-containing protein [Methylomirabilota bacterium]|jgi:hypothetical protein|nr:DUF3592 domain-containing protein [Methylomirabilota bacterium]
MKEVTGSQLTKGGGRWLDALAIMHVALTVTVVAMVVQTCRITANPETATAVVESKKVIDGGEDPDTFQLSYNFEATSGGQYRGRASVSQRIYDRTSLGDQLAVQYAADDPGNNRIISETGDPDLMRSVFYGIAGLGVFLYLGPRRWLRLRRGQPDPILT